MNENLNVVELFAGVGGFRLALEKADKDFFETLWAPSKNAQEKYECYKSALLKVKQIMRILQL
ncbi:putative protein OS=Lysinibacillus sphaericus OX=1421 GN=LS41612_04820 PE=4 SV=1 [Lysinibacillus sphaericus]